MIMKDVLIPILTLLFGVFATYVSARRKFRDDLQAQYDKTLHESRMASYKILWAHLEVLAKYARLKPVTHDSLTELASHLRDWYFKHGGLFLTDNSRESYFALQDAIVAEFKNQHSVSEELSETAFETIRRKGSDLRTSLCTDLRSRRQPEF